MSRSDVILLRDMNATEFAVTCNETALRLLVLQSGKRPYFQWWEQGGNLGDVLMDCPNMCMLLYGTGNPDIAGIGVCFLNA